ncbi:MAG: arginyl-tRNA synthetase [Candidatus Latescibacterota bacterium]|jgi:arginyl-tRNA synthetase
MAIKEQLEERIGAALEAAGAPAGSPALVGAATRPEFGDYQANGVMAVAKVMKTNPRQLAAEVVAKLDLEDVAESVDIAGPGFINVKLKREWLDAYLNEALADERLGVPEIKKAQRVVLDYSHPNLAKEMHVGHLRSTIIGDALARTLEFLGDEVIRHNHVGDWGTQFGMLIAYMDRLEAEGEDTSVELADLEVFYQSSRKLFDSDEAFANTAREYVVKLQSGDEHVRSVWQRFIGESLKHCEEVYEKLGVTLAREDVRAESAYNDDLVTVVDDLRAKGLLRESEGAQCVFLDEFKNKDGEITPVIIQKSDGGYLYATTDLSAVRYRANEVGAERVLYIVDARQALHLRQVFAVSQAAGYAPDSCSLEHHPFGTMLGNDGKPFKTRTGGTVKLMDLLREAEDRALALVGEKNPDLDESERREIARVVGIGSVKYADLSLSRTTDYIFNWEKMLSFEGNTAPYLQYSYARVKSIFRRAELDEDTISGTISVGEKAERALGVKLVQFGEIVEGVSRECYPNILCNYLYELAELYMKFYEICPVLRADEPVRSSRLLLCKLTAKVIARGLGLLGIGTVERM